MLNVWVGEKVAVSVASRGEFPAVPGIATFEWCIGGNAIDGYTGYSEGDVADPDGPEKADEILLTGDEIGNQSIDFYWIDGGTMEISVSANAIGQAQIDDASFVINSPNVTVDVNATEIPRFTVDGDGKDSVDIGAHGISFERSLDIDTSNTYRWTQIVDYDYVTARRLGELPTTYHRPSGVDNRVVYKDEATVSDSPLLPYNHSGYTEVRREFGAKMYLMYRRSSLDSIWVSLYTTEWSFDWTVEKQIGVWKFIGVQSPPTFMTFEASELPEWFRIYKNDSDYVPIL
ncbi:MAG: hypothetical protein DWH91_13150 [Planctomycetota bacterium]|nr:MAG: hypothetical protein DWH91_13150 [Planctomycetota bacterium]